MAESGSPHDPHEMSDIERRRVGLCADCRHARVVESSRGSRFYLCGLSVADPSFPKYPRLPVLECRGYETRQE